MHKFHTDTTHGEQGRRREWCGGVLFVWISIKSVRTGVWKGISSLIFREVLGPDEFQVKAEVEAMEIWSGKKLLHILQFLLFGQDRDTSGEVKSVVM